MNESQNSLVVNCEEQFINLAKSPSFNMSLGAKELFHSNFLAFLLETKHKSLVNVQNNLKKCFGLDENKKVFVWREKSNLDLVLIQVDIDSKNDWQRCSPKVAIIENKLKSIPSKKQLIEYDKKIKKGMDFCLDCSVDWGDGGKVEIIRICEQSNELALMLRRPNASRRCKENGKKAEIKKYIISMQEFKNDVGWESVQWEEIAELISKDIGKEGDNEFLMKLIKDYSETLKNIILVSKETINFCLSYKQSEKFTLSEFCNQITSPEFKNLRIHDLVGKIAFSQLEQLLTPSISKIEKIGNIEFNRYPFYSNQLPGLCFEWLITQKQKDKEIKFSIGVQVQGHHYRHFIEAYPESLDSKLIDFGKNTMQDWFYPHNILESGFPEFFGKMKVANEFLKFNKNKFIYTRTDNKKLTFNQLETQIDRSMKYALHIILGKNSEIKKLMKGGYKK